MQVINRQEFDRIPIYGWVRANLEDQISGVFGSVVAFEDRYEFDYAHIFSGPLCYDRETIATLRKKHASIEPTHLLDCVMHDPNDSAAFGDIISQVRHHKEARGRFVYVQTPGIFEPLNDVFGIENHLAYMLLYPDELKAVYRRQADWNMAFAMNCLELGVDMIHLSDDWGSQTGPIFSPQLWRETIFPLHKEIVGKVKDRGAYASLHSDGNITPLLDGITEIGYDVIHPYQESAGMSYDLYKSSYADKFTVMGGLDVQTTIGFGNLDLVKSEIDRVLSIFHDRGMLFCTTHFVQEHCTIEELTFAYDYIFEAVRSRVYSR